MKISRPKCYSSHNGILIKALLSSKGPVCELGCGLFSTPLLHWLCKEMNRELITYENSMEYFPFAKSFQSRLHRIRKIESWDDVDFKKHFGVVLIDHEPSERRGPDAIRFKDNADYLVLHDTEPKTHKIYGYDKAFSQFKYRYDWKKGFPNTSIVSNFYSLDKFDDVL